MIEKGKRRMEHSQPLRPTGSELAGPIDGQSLANDKKSNDLNSLSRSSEHGQPSESLRASYIEDVYRITSDVSEEVGLVHVKESMGVQGGEDNHQVNVYVRSLSCGVINMDQVLGEPEVQDVLELLAENPGDRSAARKADSVLARGPRWLEARGSVAVDCLEDVGSSQTRSFTFDFIAFLVEDSQGVQLGNHCVQENEFVFSLKSDLTAAQLLATSSEARRAIIESVRQEGVVPASDQRMLTGLTAALEVAVSGIDGVPREGRVIRPPRQGVLNVSNELGVTIGNAVTQDNRTQVVVATPRMRATFVDLMAAPAKESGIFSVTAQEEHAESAHTAGFAHVEVQYVDQYNEVSFADPSVTEHADECVISFGDPRGVGYEWPMSFTDHARERSRGDDRYDHDEYGR